MGRNKLLNKKKISAFIYGLLLSVALVWGYQLETTDHVEFGSVTALAFFVALTIVITLATYGVWSLLDKYKDKNKSNLNTDINNTKTGLISKILSKPLYTWLTLCILCMPVLLGVYPGFFVYDAQTEVMEVITRQFTTHHPLLHVLLLGVSVVGTHKVTGSYNLGIFLYMLMQMAVMNAVFTKAIWYLKKKGAGFKSRVATILYYGLFPTIVMYTLCSSKDGLFSAFMLLTVIYLMELSDDVAAFMTDRKKVLSLIASGTLMMVFRHNGFYAYVVFAVIYVAISFIKKGIIWNKTDAISDNTKASYKKYRIQVIGALLITIVLYMVINKGLALALNADDSEHQEMLTVPIQQVARVYYGHADDMPDDDKEVLYKYISEEGLSHYTPRLSDIIKLYFDNEAYEEDSQSFWNLYFKYLKKYPATYINAWFMTSYGYWYPGAVINVYQGNTVFTFTYTDSSYFGYEVEEPGTRESLISIIDKFYRMLSIEKFQQNIPVVSLFFAPAAYFWFEMMLVLYALTGSDINDNKRTAYKFIPFMLPLLVWATALLGPTYLVRYVIILWYLLPLIIKTSLE